ncbi:MAG: alpha/beta fold hydrolase [Gemmatimonadetes bacterium]|nr:alpha/beta fold hydrolase [Gemmatimonadota bacterium]
MRRSADARILSLLLLATVAAPRAADGQVSGVFRIYQGTAELGRESFRRLGDTLVLETLVPVVNLRVSSRTVLGGDGFRSFSMSVTNATGDTTRGSYTARQDDDTLRISGQFGRTSREVTRAGRPALVLPPQSTFAFAELVRRFPGRDTTVLVLVAGADTLLPVGMHYHGDSVRIAFAGLEIVGAVRGGGLTEFTIPAQRVRAVLANPTDTLLPLAGLRRPAPDYAAPAGATWRAEEVRVPAGAGTDTFSLACTLVRPAVGRPPFPVAVTITGSGSQQRDEDLWPLLPAYRLFGEVAERLGAAGLASLRCDDRGTGGSTGHADSATTADLAEDTRAQLRWLRGQRDIDARRIALVGHSEGAMIAPLLGAQDRAVAALALLAGPSKNGTEILVDQMLWPIRTTPDLTPEVRAERLAEAERQVRADSMPALAWLRWFRHYEPLRAARLVRQPVLILQGALDRQVTAGQADSLAAAIRSSGNRKVEVRVFPGLNHLFLPSPTDGSPAEYTALGDARIPDEVLNTLTSWLVATLR